MKKLIALYKVPKDPEAFMERYRSGHLPLVDKIPNLIRTELTLIDRTLMGEPGNYLLAEMYFENDAFKDAMQSPENAAAGGDLAKFAGGLVTIMIGSIVP
ncbi:MAG: EthD family reductase [Phenylobacterium sp.]|uniref:EthD family reductase n=1 Tax=Phenylobacterium sp. TaxID=1871053 RepID=UPI0025DA6D5B|nr:EthD family reductase [Phenylobacterium sp.]MCG9917535.1 EthD family reductase [Phenylobacterium sp.]